MFPRLFSIFATFVLLITGVATNAAAREAREQQRIDFLLATVAALPKVVFIRNGSEYDAKAAVSHLKQKLDYGGEKIQTAEQFIEYCATKSSMSGQAYKLRFPDGTTRECGPFLRAELKRFDDSKH